MLQLSHGEFDLIDVIGEALEIIRSEAVLGEVFVDFDIAEGTHRKYTGDYLYLMKMTSNLFRDAIERMSYGMTTLVISETDNVEHKLKIGVRDTGRGISGQVADSLLAQYSEVDYRIESVNGVGSCCYFSINVTPIGDEMLTRPEELLGQLKLRKGMLIRKSSVEENADNQAAKPMEAEEQKAEEQKDIQSPLQMMPPVPDMSEMPFIPDINWEYAYSLSMDNEISLMTAQSFYKSLDKEIKDIGMLYEGVDNEAGLNAYKIRVHGLKGVTASFGAMQISAIAKICELAAKNGNVERVHIMHPILMEELLNIRKNWTDLIPPSEDKPLCQDLDKFKESLVQLKESMTILDIDIADAIVADIVRYSYGSEADKLVSELETAVSNLDGDMTSEICDKILGIV